MAGRKRKIPAGYMPRWDSDSDNSDINATSESHDVQGKKKKSVSSTPPGATYSPPLTMETKVEDEPVPAPEMPSFEPQGQPQIIITDEDEDIVMHDENEEHEVVVDNEEQQQVVDGEEREQISDNEEQDNHDHDDIILQMHEQLNMFEEDEEVVPIEEAYEESDDNFENDDEFEEDFWSGSEQQEDKESFQYVLKKFAEDWLGTEINHKVSKIASSEFWNITRKWMTSLNSAFVKEKRKKFPKFEHIRKKLKKEKVPPISLNTGYVNKETKVLSVARETNKIPVRDFPPDKYEKVFEIASVKVQNYILYILTALYATQQLSFSSLSFLSLSFVLWQFS